MHLLILVVLFFTQNVSSQTFDYCSSSWDSGSRAVLDKNSVVRPGPIRAVAVHFCRGEQVELQLWEWVLGLEYRLVWKITVEPPTQLPGRTLINLKTEDQIELNSDARIGLYAMADGAIPVGTVFYSDGSKKVNPAFRQHTNYTVGETYLFDDIQYPYEFYTQVCSQYDCQERGDPVLPQVLPGLIPSEFLDCSDRLLEANRKSVIESQRVLLTGRFRAIITYFCFRSPVTVQIWQRTQTDHYVLKWMRTLQPPRQLGRRTVHPVGEADSFPLSSEHRLGLTSSDSIIPTPTMFVTEGADVIISKTAGNFMEENTYEFDSLDFPFEFRIAFCSTDDCLAEGTTIEPTSATTTTPEVTMTTTATTSATTTATPTTIDTTLTTTDTMLTTTDITLRSTKATMTSMSSTSASGSNTLSSSMIPETTKPTTTTEMRSPGPPGPVGPQGVIGEAGPSGSKGPVGNKGIRGPPGTQGEYGLPGEPGDSGRQGSVGQKGLKGDTGPRGDPGVTGVAGPPGLPGQSGAPFLAALKETCNCHTFQNKYLILGLIIWAVVLTLLILIITCVAARDTAKMKKR